MSLKYSMILGIVCLALMNGSQGYFMPPGDSVDDETEGLQAHKQMADLEQGGAPKSEGKLAIEEVIKNPTFDLMKFSDRLLFDGDRFQPDVMKLRDKFYNMAIAERENFLIKQLETQLIEFAPAIDQIALFAKHIQFSPKTKIPAFTFIDVLKSEAFKERFRNALNKYEPYYITPQDFGNPE